MNYYTFILLLISSFSYSQCDVLNDVSTSAGIINQLNYKSISECYGKGWIKSISLLVCDSGSRFVRMRTKNKVYDYRLPDTSDFDEWCDSDFNDYYKSNVQSNSDWSLYRLSRCSYMTKSGERCVRVDKLSNSRCWQHTRAKISRKRLKSDAR